MSIRFLLALPLAVGLLSGAAPASAAGLQFTSMIHASTAGQVQCTAVNVGTSPVLVTARLYDSGGVVDETIGFELAAGASASLASELDASGAFYCTFEGLTKTTRGALEISENSQSVLVLPAAR